MKSILPLAILLLFGLAGLHAQVRMESLSVADGLSQGFITSIIQDSQGFIWMGTFDGLNRYDGYSVRHFKPKPFDSLSIQSSYITALFEDPQHYIWVGTAEGLYLFNPQKEHFYRLCTPAFALPAQHIAAVTGDKDGNILVQFSIEKNRGGDIFQLNLPPDFLRQARPGHIPIAGIQVRQVSIADPYQGSLSLMNCIGDTMFLASDSLHCFQYSFREHQFHRFDLHQIPASQGVDHCILWAKHMGYIFRWQLPDGRDSVMTNKHWVTAIRMGNGRIGAWFYPKGGLATIKNNAPIRCNLSQPNEALIEQAAFKNEFNILFDEQQPSWKEFSFWNNNIITDRSGVLWLATGGWGIRKFNSRQINFGKILQGQSIAGIQELPNQRLWIKSYSDKTFVLNTVSQQLEAAPWESALGKKDFYGVYVTTKGNYWLIDSKFARVDEKKLLLYEPESGLITRFPVKLPFLEAVPEKIMEDRNGNIWIAANTGELFRCRPDQHSLEHFSYASLMLADRNILRATAINQDAGGTIWIGTNKGLVRLDHANDAVPQFSLLRNDLNNPKSLSMDWVTCISRDPVNMDILWLGTRGGGLNRLHIPSQTFSCWTQAPDELPDNVVYGILPDAMGNLWCSTNRGICRFNPLQNVFTSYQESDGLSSTEFNTNAYLRGRDGRFWFGGVNGLSVFRPEDMGSPNAPPSVAITGIKVRGVQRFPDDPGIISLPFGENNVLFEFAALDFGNPSTNRFRHRLRGIEKEWVNDGTTHSVNYAALPPGHYVFEIQAATADSRWSEQSVLFTLHIRTPWYRSLLAYCCYLLLGVAAIYAYFRYQTLQNTALLNHRESLRLKKFKAIKNQFFADVAHELRTPLTVITGLAERLRKGEDADKVPENAQIILKQGEQLLHLTNQVLDLARLESDHFQLHLQNDNIIPFIKNHVAALVPLAASKGIRIIYEVEISALWIDFDPQQIQKVLNNLISNAIRHTPPGGKIVVKTSIDPDENWLNIQVTDSGEGIREEDLPHIFDRFFQGNNPQSEVGASGIGLTLTRDLIQHMGGRVSVDSVHGEGTVFSIRLPIKNESASHRPLHAEIPVQQDTAPELIKNPAGKMPLMLVIEDNPDVSTFLRLCLQPYFQLTFTTNGAQGIEKALELIPDIILTDVAMPLKNGYEVCAILKEDERTRHIPIAMLTAKAEASDRMEAHRRGANAYLTKPFNEAELLLVLQNLLHLQKQWRHRYGHFAKEEILQDQKDLAPQEQQVEDNFMQKVRAIFESNYVDDNFNLDSLCQELNMSSSQLDRKIKALTNQSPMQMLRIFRLQKAKALMQQEPGLSIKEVCFRSGFKNPSHFSRLYSKEFGTPPSAG